MNRNKVAFNILYVYLECLTREFLKQFWIQNRSNKHFIRRYGRCMRMILEILCIEDKNAMPVSHFKLFIILLFIIISSGVWMLFIMIEKVWRNYSLELWNLSSYPSTITTREKLFLLLVPTYTAPNFCMNQ